MVSAVVLHHDRRRCLRQALDSIAAQTWRAFEVVVVSDAGPESSRGVVDAFGAAHAGAFEVRWVRRELNGGVAAARNTGVAAARGDRIAFLDDDDLWRPGHLASLTRVAAPIAYGDAEVQRMEPFGSTGHAPDGDLDPSLWRVAERAALAVAFDPSDLARDDFIVPSGMLVTRAALDAVGLFDETIHVSDDWDWLLRALAARGPSGFARVPEVVVDVRIWGGNANQSGVFDARRREALDTLERRHGTPRLEPKTFWEVAQTYAARDAT